MTDPRIFDTAVKLVVSDVYWPFDPTPPPLVDYVVMAEKLVAGLDAIIAQRNITRQTAAARIRSDQKEHRP